MGQLLSMSNAVEPYQGQTQTSDEHYQQWTARFDLLWSSPDAHRHRTEMDRLIALINAHEGAQNESLIGDIG